MDVQFGPKGISFDVTLENADEDARETFFKVKSVKVSIIGFDYQIRNNDHWMATWLAKAPVRAILLVSDERSSMQPSLTAQGADLIRPLYSIVATNDPGSGAPDRRVVASGRL